MIMLYYCAGGREERKQEIDQDEMAREKNISAIENSTIIQPLLLRTPRSLCPELRTTSRKVMEYHHQTAIGHRVISTWVVRRHSYFSCYFATTKIRYVVSVLAVVMLLALVEQTILIIMRFHNQQPWTNKNDTIPPIADTSKKYVWDGVGERHWRWDRLTYLISSSTTWNQQEWEPNRR